VGRTSCASHAAAEEYVCIFSLLYPLSHVSALSLSLLPNSERLCVIRTQRDQSASQERISTVVALVSGAMPLTCRRETAAVSRYTVAFKVLEDSVSGGAGDSSGFRGSAFTAPPGGGGRCRPHSMSDARFWAMPIHAEPLCSQSVAILVHIDRLGLCCARYTLIRSSCFALSEHRIARRQQDGDGDISCYHPLRRSPYCHTRR